VRAADDGTYVVTGGFSCREQIVQATGHEVLHPAQLLAQAIARKGSATDGSDATTRGGTPRGNPDRKPGDPARRPTTHSSVSA
jgi:hypothetical protein